MLIRWVAHGHTLLGNLVSPGVEVLHHDVPGQDGGVLITVQFPAVVVPYTRQVQDTTIQTQARLAVPQYGVAHARQGAVARPVSDDDALPSPDEPRDGASEVSTTPARPVPRRRDRDRVTHAKLQRSDQV